jgi:hypothetical protein
MPSGADLKIGRQILGDNLFYLKDNFRIGIGTSDPQSLLHVNGNLQGQLARLTRVVIGDAGLAPEGPLTMKSEPATPDLIILRHWNTTAYWKYGFSANGFDLEWKADNQVRFKMDYDGDVGIGVTSPAAKLDVGGNLKIQGDITVTGKIPSMTEVHITNTQMSDGWINYDQGFAPFSYYKDKEGVVRLSGLIKNGTGPDILESGGFVLPAEYCPSHSLIFAVVSGNNGFTRVDVRANGTISIVGTYSNAYVSLDGISFRAAVD